MYFKDFEFDLPKKTLEMQKKIDALNNATSTEKAYKSAYEFIVLSLGKDKTKEILGSNDINKIDLIELMELYNTITVEQSKVMQKPQIEMVQEVLSQLNLEKLIDVSKIK